MTTTLSPTAMDALVDDHFAAEIAGDLGRLLATFADGSAAVRYAMKERQRRAEDGGLEIRVVLPDQVLAAA